MSYQYTHYTAPQQAETDAYIADLRAAEQTSYTPVDLTQRKNEKTEQLHRKKMGLSSTDLTDTTQVVGGHEEWMGNKILNEYTPEELQYLQGRAYKEFGVFRNADTESTDKYLTYNENNELVPYKGTEEDLASLYGYMTKDGGFKPGKWGGADSDDRYTHKSQDPNLDRYGKPIGEGGVDIEQQPMELLYPRGVNDLMEHILQGNVNAMEGRVARKDPNDPSSYWEAKDRIGTGFTEVYNDIPSAFGGAGDVRNLGDDNAKEALWQDFATKYGLLSTEPRKMTPEEFRSEVRKLEAQNRGAIETAVYEVGQAVAGMASGVFKGAIDLVDAGFELATWAPQTAVRMATGNKNFDIDIIPDEFKKAAIGFVDNITGYDREADEETLAKVMKHLDASGINITSMDSFKQAMSNPEQRGEILSAIKEVGANPALVFSSLAEIVGAGGALGFITKGGAKVTAKIAPKVGEKIGRVVQSNESKVRAQIASLPNTLSPAERAAATLQLQKSLTLAKKLPDLMKGTVYTNADLAIRMNEDLTQYQINNNGEPAGPLTVLQMTVVNRMLSSAEVSALKFEAKIGQIGLEAAQTGVAAALKDAGLHIVKSGVIEGVQETLDGIAQNINQKLGTEKYQDMTIKDILEEASSEILAGTIIGTTAGVEVAGLTELANSGVISGTGNVIASGYNKSKDALHSLADKGKEVTEGLKEDIRANFGSDEEVDTALNSVAPTPEARAQVVDSFTDQQKEADIKKAEKLLSTVKSAAGIEEGGVVDASNASNVATVLLGDLAYNVEKTLADPRTANLNPEQKGKLQDDVAGMYLSNIGSTMSTLRAVGKGAEADAIVSALIEALPSTAGKILGSSPKALESFINTTVIEAAKSETLDVDTMIQKVRSVVANLNIPPESKKDITDTINTAVQVGKAYKSASLAKKGTDEVGFDVAAGNRGFLRYYDTYEDAISKGDKPKALAFRERLQGFQELQETKYNNFRDAVENIEAEVFNRANQIRAEKGNVTATDLRKALMKDFSGSSKKVLYGTNKENSFNINYSDIINNAVAPDGDRSSPAYRIMDNIRQEVDAMTTLLAYSDSRAGGKRMEVAAVDTVQSTPTQATQVTSTPVTAQQTPIATVQQPIDDYGYDSSTGISLDDLDRMQGTQQVDTVPTSVIPRFDRAQLVQGGIKKAAMESQGDPVVFRQKLVEGLNKPLIRQRMAENNISADLLPAYIDNEVAKFEQSLQTTKPTIAKEADTVQQPKTEPVTYIANNTLFDNDPKSQAEITEAVEKSVSTEELATKLVDLYKKKAKSKGIPANDGDVSKAVDNLIDIAYPLDLEGVVFTNSNGNVSIKVMGKADSAGLWPITRTVKGTVYKGETRTTADLRGLVEGGWESTGKAVNLGSRSGIKVDTAAMLADTFIPSSEAVTLPREVDMVIPASEADTLQSINVPTGQEPFNTFITDTLPVEAYNDALINDNVEEFDSFISSETTAQETKPVDKVADAVSKQKERMAKLAESKKKLRKEKQEAWASLSGKAKGIIARELNNLIGEDMSLNGLLDLINTDLIGYNMAIPESPAKGNLVGTNIKDNVSVKVEDAKKVSNEAGALITRIQNELKDC
jgi:hypothetical protein